MRGNLPSSKNWEDSAFEERVFPHNVGSLATLPLTNDFFANQIQKKCGLSYYIKYWILIFEYWKTWKRRNISILKICNNPVFWSRYSFLFFYLCAFLVNNAFFFFITTFLSLLVNSSKVWVGSKPNLQRFFNLDLKLTHLYNQSYTVVCIRIIGGLRFV